VFTYEGQHFCNIQNKKCLDIYQKTDKEGQDVNVEGRTDNENQQWNVVYLDKAKPEPTKGLNKEFGMHINRPFYLVSRLPMRRVAEMVGASNIVLKRWTKNRAAQQFWFDQKTKTIRSNQWKNYIIEIQSNGKSNNLRATASINSRWW
jgi:hypothetical protein